MGGDDGAGVRGEPVDRERPLKSAMVSISFLATLLGVAGLSEANAPRLATPGTAPVDDAARFKRGGERGVGSATVDGGGEMCHRGSLKNKSRHRRLSRASARH